MLFKFTISILLCLTMALGVSASAASTTVSAEADVGSAEIAHYLRIWRLAAPDIRGPLVRNFFTNHSISLDWWISDLEETRAAVVERTNALNDSITRNINDLTELNLKKLLPVLKKSEILRAQITEILMHAPTAKDETFATKILKYRERVGKTALQFIITIEYDGTKIVHLADASITPKKYLFLSDKTVPFFQSRNHLTSIRTYPSGFDLIHVFELVSNSKAEPPVFRLSDTKQTSFGGNPCAEDLLEPPHH